MSRNIAVSVISKVRSAAAMPASAMLGRDLVDEARVLELERRQVDAEAELLEAGPVAATRRPGGRRSQSTDRPRARIVPVSSARRMNSVGSIGPRVGWFQRTSASTPTIRPVARVDDRLVVDLEVAPADAPAEVGR